MKVKSLITLFLASTALLFLDSCSRESPIKENTGLKNNHSRVFISKNPFKDPQAFLDSMANTAVVESDTIPDTLTVTVNDTVHLLGMLPRFVDKIYRFQWNLTKANGKDSTIRVNVEDYGKPITWTYAKEGLYHPVFIAFDGNNASDTAGSGSKRSYVKVIDTYPVLGVPKDTLWTSHDGDVEFGILAADTFGTIKSLKIDLDASGKDSAQTWKYSQEGDSLFITIKNNKKYIDSLGNQTIYVIIEDDDGNVAKDSVYLHFNKPPTLRVISPLDGSSYDISKLFQFFYESTDEDNPQDLRFYIYAKPAEKGRPPKTAFTSDDLIADGINSTVFEPVNAEGKNAIALINKPGTELTGIIYWEMYVTDGYDIVRTSRIKDTDSTDRAMKFSYANLSASFGIFSGTAKYEGRDSHAGIRIEFNNGSKVFTGFTDKNGNYSVKVDFGDYEVRASSDTIREYQHAFQYNLSVGLGFDDESVEDLILKDTTSPALVVKSLDTLNVREIPISIFTKDLASRVGPITAKFDDQEQALTCTPADSVAPLKNCNLALVDMLDGKHVLEISAKDKAGNVSLHKDTIYVMGTNLDLDVNGKQKDRIGDKAESSLIFTIQVSDAFPVADKVELNWTVEEDSHTETLDLDEDGKASYTLKYVDIAKAQIGKDYIMSASYKSNGADITKEVAFGILGEDPTVIFTKPGKDTKITKNDPVEFEIVAYPGDEHPITNKIWDCSKAKLAAGFNCPADGSSSAILAFSDYDQQEISVTITSDDPSITSTDKAIVEVIKDPPTINLSTNEKSNEHKINSKINVDLVANDKFGTVNEIKWGCGTGAMIVLSSNVNISAPAKEITKSVEVQMPGREADGMKFKCAFEAIDDDGESSGDTLTFIPLIDLPTIQVSPKRDTVKIKSTQKIKAIGKDKLGKIVKYEYACDDDLKELKNPSWNGLSGTELEVLMPEYATNYFCVIQVTDDDDNTARDTTSYKVVVGRPSVEATVNYKQVTIRDVVELNAYAQDSLGYIKSYEWGCGPKGTANIGFTTMSDKTPRMEMAMPAEPYDNYLCIIKVTDDDGNIAMDTTESIQIIQAPPTVTVSNKKLTIRPKYNIALGATASDNNGLPSDPGEIIKREWSCGVPEEIEKNWKVVSEFDTTWKAPDVENKRFICIARATDNDSLTALDTMTFSFSVKEPEITVADHSIYVVQGDEFTLDARINDVWQGIDWFRWDCYDAETKKTMETAPNRFIDVTTFDVIKDTSYSMKGKDMYCVVTAKETSTKAEFTDTTYVNIMKNYPTGVISAADTVYIWSGDEKQNNEARYFYSPSWGGFCSKRGDLSSSNSPQAFYWTFSNVAGRSYKGNSDGSMDTSLAQFNSAFIRSKTEGTMTITLEYRDSVSSIVTESFLVKHRAPEVSRTVYFKKAWQNLGQDTVIETSAANTAPAFINVGNKSIVAYMTQTKAIKVASYEGNEWKTIGNITSSDSITTIKLATDGTDLYIATLTNAGKLLVWKSVNATSDPSSLGSISNVKEPDLLVDPKGKKPVVLYIGNGGTDNGKPKIAKYNSTWSTESITSNSTSAKHIEIKAAFNSDGSKLYVAALDTSNAAFTARIYIMNNLAKAGNPAATMTEINKLSVAVDGTSLYVAYMNRNKDKTYVRRYAISSTSLSNGTDLNDFEGMLRSYHTSIVAKNGIVYLAIDDKGKPNQAQTHVYRYENNAWHYHGENQLPYFGSQFYETKGYYLRGSSPTLSMDSEGNIYVVMLTRVQKMYKYPDDLDNTEQVGNDDNNGPMVMKYIANNWKVTPTTCEEK